MLVNHKGVKKIQEVLKMEISNADLIVRITLYFIATWICIFIVWVSINNKIEEIQQNDTR